MTIDFPRVLLIDSYDSFTFNLASLCRRSIPRCTIHIVKNDEMTIDQLIPHLSRFSAIIVGPGPGSPEVSSDIGFIKDLWKVAEEHLIPVFGVCLGLQSLGLEFGGQLRRLNVVKHGQVSKVHHKGTDLFRGVQEVNAVRYHSLHIQLDDSADSELVKIAWADDGAENGEVIMGIKHRTRPFWAVQYHPESVCTRGGGLEVVQNFWAMAQEWNRKHNRTILYSWSPTLHDLFGHQWPHLNAHTPPPSASLGKRLVQTSVIDLSQFEVTDICEKLGVWDESKPFVLLDSAAEPGRFTVVGALDHSSIRLSYDVGDPFVRVYQDGSSHEESLGDHSVWSWIASFMRLRRFEGNPDIPFWGGLVGHLTYELGVSSLGVRLHREGGPPSRHHDANLVFVERSVVYDKLTGRAYVQSLIPSDQQWVSDTVLMLQDPLLARVTNDRPEVLRASAAPVIRMPDKDVYISRINQAKESLFCGDSYELCLTARTRINIIDALPTPPTTQSSSWARYKHLRVANPAPHSAYIRLSPTTLLSSSPERFLSYSRAPHSVCQLRPIKGTVRKKPGIDRKVAEQMLVGSVKEVAENLMIVDLIRHDLHSVVGDDVEVKKFCGVEEYKNVWQLTSVIEGKLPDTMDAAGDEVGWQVLQQSLPPGSMTGAPKKRSVEILQKLEDDERGIYSGVFGYWDVGGAGDWSVTIRSCFKFSEEVDNPTGNVREEWVLGAGGAITALSDAEAEWDEMVVKLEGVLRSFGLSAP